MADDNPQYPITTQLDIGIDEVEDRIALIGQTRKHGYRLGWLTRRLLYKLLQRYTDILAGSSPTASQVMPSHRDEVLQMEHVSALATQREAADDGSAPTTPVSDKLPAARRYLITDAHFKSRDAQLVLALDGVQRPLDANPAGERKEPVFAMVLDRTNAHKVLATLKSKGDDAGWGLPEPSRWTDRLQRAGSRPVN